MTVLDDKGLGRIQRVPLRDVWGHEAIDFTPWLADNLDLLSEALGVDELTLVDTEVSVGDFALDVHAEDAYGYSVVIENQLERSDHNHLGQLLAYAAGLDASMVIWVAPDFREEHRSTLTWLNEHLDDEIGLFAVAVQAIKIGDSPAAPSFDVVVRPNEWDKQVQEQAGSEPSEINQLRRAFYESSFVEVDKILEGFWKPKAQAQSWNAFRSGSFGNFGFAFTHDGRFRVEVYLDNSIEDLPTIMFDELHAKRELYEALISEDLSWERLDDARASRICVYRDQPDLADSKAVASAAQWSARIAKELIEAFENDVRARAKELIAEHKG